MTILNIAFDYPVDYTPRGGRVVREARVREVLPFSFPELSSPPPALRLRYPLTEGGRVFDLARASYVDIELPVHGGALVGPRGLFPAGAPGGVDPAVARAPAPLDPGAPIVLYDPDAPELAKRSLVERSEVDAARKVHASGEEAARARALAAAGRMCVADGVLMEPVPEPVWVLQCDHSTNGARVDVLLSTADRHSALHHPIFPLDRRDEAFAMAGALAAEECRARFSPVPTVIGEAEIAPGYRCSYDAVSDFVPSVIRAFEAYGNWEGFHLLPRPCLLAWADYRDALPGALLGEGGAAMAAMEALDRFRADLPPHAPGQGSGLSIARGPLAGALRVYRASLAWSRGAAAREDEAGLAALSPAA